MPPRDEPESAPAPASRRRRTIAVAVGAVVVVAVVLALVLTGRGGDSPSPDDTTSTAQPSGGTPGVAPGQDASGESTSTSPPAAGPDTPESPPVGLDASPAVVDGVTVRVKSLTAVDGEAVLPGEVAGPAVRAELEMVNESGAAVDLSTVVVNLAYGSGRTPANTLSTGTSSFPASVATGTTATGTYVFEVPSDERDDLRLTVDYAVDVPVVVFEGSAS
jgi:hypothetical protein